MRDRLPRSQPAPWWACADAPPRPSPATPWSTAAPSCGSLPAALALEAVPTLPPVHLARAFFVSRLSATASHWPTPCRYKLPNGPASRPTRLEPRCPTAAALRCSPAQVGSQHHPLRCRRARRPPSRGSMGRIIRRTLGKRTLGCRTAAMPMQFEGNRGLRCLGRASGCGGGSGGSSRLRCRAMRRGSRRWRLLARTLRGCLARARAIAAAQFGGSQGRRCLGRNRVAILVSKAINVGDCPGSGVRRR